VTFATSRAEEAPASTTIFFPSQKLRTGLQEATEAHSIYIILGNLYKSVFSDTSRLDRHTDIFKSDIVIISQYSG